VGKSELLNYFYMVLKTYFANEVGAVCSKGKGGPVPSTGSEAVGCASLWDVVPDVADGHSAFMLFGRLSLHDCQVSKSVP
jgi:hypothetical protein